jgi:tRNA (guanine-N7-)-methyltransferase
MKKAIKSFVLRAGRLSPRQQQGLEQWLGDYLLPPPDALWNLPALFAREAPTIVEIGFGMGASLAAMAKQEPETNFLGIEVHRAGIGSLAACLHDEGIQNVRIAPYDAMDVFQHAIAAHQLAGVQIFFPDPWPKKRHHKRRLIQTEFIHLLVEKLQVGAFLHCATDWQDYALHILPILQAESGLSNTSSQGDFVPRPERRPRTKFEERGQRLGHEIWDMLFIRR